MLFCYSLVCFVSVIVNIRKSFRIMKKSIIYLVPLLLLFAIPSIKAQVLYDEDFDNYTLGNLGTDPTGTTPGQGGWYTYSKYTKANSFFTISNETGRGKVLNLSTGSVNNEFLTVSKEISYATIANRLPGNDVFMFEIDYYTGSVQPLGSVGGSESQIELFSSSSTEGRRLAHSYFNKSTGSINNNGKLPFNTWIKFIFYIDYPNRKDYLHIFYLNKVYVNERLKYETSPNLIQDFPISGIKLTAGYSGGSSNPLSTYIRNRYDNIKITALNAVPPYVLNAENFLAQKFNLYPNPATNIINITNSENIVVQQIMVYDVAGKQLSTQTFNNKTEIQLNVENLASGTYLLHIQTNEGTAVKKVVKK